MSPGLFDLADEEFCYLTTSGRKTGRPHEIEIWFALSDSGETLYMLSGGRDRSDWVRNLKEEPRVSVRISDKVFEGRARVIAGEDDDPLARDLLVEKYEKDPRRLARWREESLPVGIRVETSYT